MSIISNSPTMKAPAQSSTKMMTSVGSGSRPTVSKHPIPTSAPDDSYGLDGRDVAGHLAKTGGKTEKWS